MFVCQDVGDASAGVSANTFASSASKTVADGIVEEAEGIEVRACCSVETEGVPDLVAGAMGWRKEGHHDMPRKCI